MAVKMGINGFGRIGRLVFRSSFKDHAGSARVMAINDPFMDKDYLMYMLKYDTVHGRFDGTIEKCDAGILVNGHLVHLFNEKDPS